MRSPDEEQVDRQAAPATGDEEQVAGVSALLLCSGAAGAWLLLLVIIFELETLIQRTL